MALIKLNGKYVLIGLTISTVLICTSNFLSNNKEEYKDTTSSTSKILMQEVNIEVVSTSIPEVQSQVIEVETESNSELYIDYKSIAEEEYLLWVQSQAEGVDETYIDEEYVKYATEIANMYDICPELVIAMIEAESSGNPNAKSGAQCIGLMQVSPKWNRDRMERLGVTDLYDPYSNILVGVDFLSELFEKYGDIYTVLMCYNEGEYGTAIERSQNGRYSNYATSISSRSEELERLHGK